MINRCQCIKKDGTQCSRNAKKDDMCTQHAKLKCSQMITLNVQRTDQENSQPFPKNEKDDEYDPKNVCKIEDIGKKKSYVFHVSEDYREGTSVILLKKEKCDIDNEYIDELIDDGIHIELSLPPKDKFRLYFIDLEEEQIIWKKDIDKNEDYVKLYLKIYSQEHGHMPFVETNITESYKQNGYYPEISEEILDLPNIQFENNSSTSIVFIINSDGKDKFIGLVDPI